MWGNLPEGEVYTAPATLEGRLVADVLGAYFSAQYGVLAEPVTFLIADSIATSPRSRRPPQRLSTSDGVTSGTHPTAGAPGSMRSGPWKGWRG
jgi:hypothetical protein